MTAPAVKNCGSCRWWGQRPGYNVGDCQHELPDSATRFEEPMYPFEGTTCPCYAPREGGEETR